MSVPITDAALRLRFREACAERDAIMARSEPLRKQRDAIQAQVGELEAQCRPLVEQYKSIEAPLFDLQNEIAAISRALKGQTAEPGA